MVVVGGRRTQPHMSVCVWNMTYEYTQCSACLVVWVVAWPIAFGPSLKHNKCGYYLMLTFAAFMHPIKCSRR